MKIPLISELARAAFTTAVPDRAMTREMFQVQEELREVSRSYTRGVGGVIVPFYVADKRDLTIGGSGATAGVVVPDIGQAIRDRLVLELLGARVYGGLRENAVFPQANAEITAQWLSETAENTETGFSFGGLSLAPKRIAAHIEVSDQLLRQTAAAELFIRTELGGALATELQRALIVGTGLSNEPVGILNTPNIGSVVGGTNGAAPDLTDLTDLEFAVTGTAKADRGRLGWLVSPKVRRKLRRTEMFASSGRPLWSEADAYRLLGHAAGVTPSVPDNLSKGSSSGVCSAVVFGDFTEIIIAIWGAGVDVFVTRSKQQVLDGKCQINAAMYCDGGVRSPGAFAAMTDALCA
jgi:HK97 family phage major capsid protein